MKQRVFTGLTLAGLLIALLLQPFTFFILVVEILVACWAYIEFDLIFFDQKSLSRRLRLCALICFSLWLLAEGPMYAWVLAWLPLFMLSLRQVIFANREGDTLTAVKELAYEIMGFYYVVCLFGFLVPIANWGMHGRSYLLLLFLVVFFGDVGAFFVGRRWGKHSLASQISPKKSIEGSIGGVLAAMGIAAVWIYFIYPGKVTPGFQWTWFTFIPVISLLAQVSDLLESLFKRSRHCKDSGTLLPGHGGILDRVDGLALAAPLFYFFLVFFGDHL